MKESLPSREEKELAEEIHTQDLCHAEHTQHTMGGRRGRVRNVEHCLGTSDVLFNGHKKLVCSATAALEE